MIKESSCRLRFFMVFVPFFVFFVPTEAVSNCDEVDLTIQEVEADDVTLSYVIGTFALISSSKETLDLNNVLFKLTSNSLLEGFTLAQTPDQSAEDYLESTLNGNKDEIQVKIIQSMLELPDYVNQVDGVNGQAIKELYTRYNMEFPEGFTCPLEMTFVVLDENTQTPNIKGPLSFDIREDYPLQLSLEEKIQINDKDGGPPNSQVAVSTDGNCPLVPVNSVIDCTEGKDFPVSLQLINKLDFEKQTSPITCTFTTEDQGTPPLSASTEITINVLAFPDEPPSFENQYYYIELQGSTVAENSPITVHPAAIKAEDEDDPPSDITYSFIDIKDGGKWMEYFEIDSKTAEIIQKKDIPDDEISEEQIVFSVIGRDESDEISTTYLEIYLPSTEGKTTTTTMSSVSTTATTCEPCICSTLPTVFTTGTTCEPCICSTPSTSIGTDTTCEPCVCSTPDSTSEFTCPTSTPCEPCASTTPLVSTTSTSPGPPTSIPPTGPTVHFKFNTYSFIMFETEDEAGTVAVTPESDNVEFGYDDEVEPSPSDAKDFFRIDSATGEIIVKKAPTPDTQYIIGVKASSTNDASIYDQAKVVILIISVTPGENPELKSSYFNVEVQEGVEVGSTVVTVEIAPTSSEVNSISLECSPENCVEYFDYERENYNIKVITQKPLEADDPKLGNQFRLTLGAYKDFTSSLPDPEDIERNEALIDLTIKDENDNRPVFVTTSIVAGLPVEDSLRKLIDVIAQFQVTDVDSTGVLSFVKQTGDGFLVDTDSGKVYYQGGPSCDPSCTVEVKVSDEVYWTEETASLKILPIPTENIYTLQLDGVSTAADVDQQLSDLSEEVQLDVRKIHADFADSPETYNDEAKHKKSGIGSEYAKNVKSASAYVDVYVLDGENIVSLDDFNEKLPDGMEASQFDDPAFQGEDVLGYQIAVGVLGGVLGLALIVAAIVFGVRRYKALKSEDDRIPLKPKINSLGNIYSNSSLNTDSVRSSIRKSPEDRYSPPGLRRLSPGPALEPSSPYIGVSHDATRIPDTELTIDDTSSSIKPSNPPTVYSSPVYSGSINPTNNISSPPPPTNPTSNFVNESKQTKNIYDGIDLAPKKSAMKPVKEDISLRIISPLEPNKDYEESTNKFGKLRGSPPPAKKPTTLTSPVPEDDEKSTVSSMTSLLKKNILKGEGTDSDSGDGNKKVDFKVLVETHEIEPRKKKKVEIIEEDDDDDDEESSKM